MPLPDQTTLLCRAIRKKGEAEAEAILADAGAKAEQIITRARKRVEGEMEAEIARRRRRALRDAGRIVDNGELKAKQRIMAARQEIMDRLFAEARSRLLALRRSPDYPRILGNLALRAVRGLPAATCRLQVRKEDMALLPDTRLRELSAQSGKEVTLAAEAAAISGGCLALAGEGRIFIDFSFDTLLERGRPLLQEILTREIPGDNRRADDD